MVEPLDADDLKAEKDEDKEQYYHFDDWSFGSDDDGEPEVGWTG